MDRLKSILADKILDLSTETGDTDIKSKLDKIHRFKDFANACKSLMTRYPGIEDELIEMITNDNFDTVEASTRVDRIVDLSENLSLETDEIMLINDSDSDEENVVVEEKKSNETIPELKSNQSQAQEEEGESYFPTEEEMVVIKRNTTIRRVLQVLAIVLAVFVLIFILKFVLLHWQTILIIVVIFVILAVLFVGYERKQK